MYHWSLSLVSFRFCETQYLHFSTRVFGHSVISLFLGRRAWARGGAWKRVCWAREGWENTREGNSDREQQRERERERERNRERERERASDSEKERDRDGKTEREEIERETGGCKGCLERQCVIVGAGARENTRVDTKWGLAVNQHAQRQSLRVVGLQTHEGRQCSVGGRAETRWHCELSHTQVQRVPAHCCLWASRTVGRAPQTLARCSMAWGAAPNSSERVCKTPEDRIFTRTFHRWGHACALRSLQLMPPGERATQNPAPRCLHGIVPINASDFGTS